MAKKINNKDFFEDGFGKPLLDFFKTLNTQIDESTKKIQGLAGELKKEISSNKLTSGADVQKLSKQKEQTESIKKLYKEQEQARKDLLKIAEREAKREASIETARRKEIKKTVEFEKREKIKLASELIKQKKKQQEENKKINNKIIADQNKNAENLRKLKNKEESDLIKLEAKRKIEIQKSIEFEKRERIKLANELIKQKKREEAETKRVNEKLRKEQEKQIAAKKKLIDKNKAEEGSLKQLRQQLNLNIKAFDSLSKEERESAQVGQVLKKEIQKLQKELLAVEQTTGRSQRNVGNYTSAWGKLSGLFKKGLAFVGITGGITAIATALKNSVKIFKDFEQGNANLAAVLGKSRSEIKALTNDAIRLGGSTAFTASQVSELQTEFAKLGFNEKEILDATEATLNLAAATGSELGEAAAIAGATLGGFGLDAEETARVTDVMAKSFSTSALDLEKFKESMKIAAPAAKAVGVSVEETTALLGTLSNAGISGSLAGTGLAKSFIQLNKAGLTLEDGLEKVINSENKLKTAVDLVGVNAAKSFLILAEGTETTKQLKIGLENAGGAAEKMAKEQLDTLEGKTKILNSAWEGLVLSLLSGDSAFSSIAKGIVEATTSLLGFLTTSEDANEVSFESARLNRDLANSSQVLLDEYESLVSKGIKPTAEEKEKLDIITLKLKDRLGESVIAIDEETGALTLNTEAVREQIKLKRFASDQEAATLASRLKGVQEQLKLEEKQIENDNKEAERRTKIQQELRNNIILRRQEQGLIESAINPNKEVIKAREEEVKAQERFIDFAEKRNKTSQSNLKNKEEEIDLLEKLKELNFTAADVEALFTVNKAKSNKEKEESNEQDEITIGLLGEIEKKLKAARLLRDSALTEEDIKKQQKIIKGLEEERDALLNIGEVKEEAKKEEVEFEVLNEEIDKKKQKRLDKAAKEEAKRLEKEKKDREAAEKAKQKAIDETIEKSFEAAEKFLEAQKNAQIQILSNQIDASKQLQNQLLTVAAGSGAAAEEARKSLALESTNQRKLESERERTIKRQAAQATILAALELTISAARRGESSPASAAASELGQTLSAAESASSRINNVVGFFTGTENVSEDLKDKKVYDGKDGYSIRVHGSERIIQGADNNKLNGLSNEELVKAGVMYKKGFGSHKYAAQTGNLTQVINSNNNEDVVKELKEVKEAFKNGQKSIDFKIDPIKQHLIKETKTQGKLLRQHYKKGRLL